MTTADYVINLCHTSFKMEILHDVLPYLLLREQKQLVRAPLAKWTII